jgi:hypothetical protein
MASPFPPLYWKRLRAAEPPAPYKYEVLPQPFRAQVLFILQRATGAYEPGDGVIRGPRRTLGYDIWETIRDVLREELGVSPLSDDARDPARECASFFKNAPLEFALGFIEFAFRGFSGVLAGTSVNRLRDTEIYTTAEKIVEELNARFDEHNLGYQFIEGLIVRRDSEYVHAQVIEPALALLRSPGFDGPHQEFIAAHKAYRDGNTKEAVRVALNAFESTIKSICTLRKWAFDPNAPAAALLRVVFDQELIPAPLQTQFAACEPLSSLAFPPSGINLVAMAKGPYQWRRLLILRLMPCI